jgi:two-component system response regulator NreC
MDYYGDMGFGSHRRHKAGALCAPGAAANQERDMNKKQRILIAEDHALLREGLRALLSSDPDLEVVGEASDGRAAVKLTGALSPDLVLMDLSMPGTDGTEAIIEIKKRYPATRMLVLTVHKTEEYIRNTLQAGADGYLLKDATYTELLIGVRSVLSGKTYLSPDVSAQVVSGYLSGKPDGKTSSAWDTLTHREREVLKLIAEGRTNKYIADYICVSVKTVEKHRSNLMKKLDLHNAAGLTAFAIEKGLIAH